MKVPFNIFQVAITTVLVFLLCGCICGNAVLYALGFMEMGQGSFIFKEAVCTIVLVLSLVFILKPSLTGFISKASSGNCNPSPALSAIRTYICFITLDASVALFIMIFGKLVLDDAVKYILILCPSIFILGAIKYIIDVKKIGVNTSNDDDDNDDYEW